MTDDQEDAAAAEVVESFRSLARQNDGVLQSLIRDALHHAVAEEREACANIVNQFGVSAAGTEQAGFAWTIAEAIRAGGQS